MSANPLQLSILPPLFIGEAKSLTIVAELTASPAAYTLEFWLRLTPQDTWSKVTSGISVSVTGAYTATFTVPVDVAFTDDLSAGLNTFQIVRTDAGPWVIASGSILVLYGG